MNKKIEKVKGVDPRNTHLFNELINAVNNGTGGVASQNLDFYACSIEAFQRHLMWFTKMLGGSTFLPIPYDKLTELSENLFTRVNKLASKAYQKDLSVAGLGIFLRYACGIYPAVSALAMLTELPQAFEVAISNYNRFFDLIENMIEYEKPIDGLSVFYTTLLIGFMMWITSCCETDEETGLPISFTIEEYNVMMSYATPFLAMIDKVTLDPTIGTSVNYDELFLQYGMNVFMIGCMFTDELDKLIDIEAFFNKYEMLPYEYYLLHGGIETYDVIKELGTTTSFLITPFLDTIDGNPDAAFPMKSDTNNRSMLNWFEYNKQLIAGMPKGFLAQLYTTLFMSTGMLEPEIAEQYMQTVNCEEIVMNTMVY